MDKLQAWMERIQLPPRQHVANLDHWELLAELRIDPGAMLMQRAKRGGAIPVRQGCHAAPPQREGERTQG